MQRLGHDFGYAFATSDIAAFQPLAAANEPSATSAQWREVRSGLRTPDCLLVAGVRSTVIRADEKDAVVIVEIDGQVRIRANGKMVPIKSPWTLRLGHDPGGWHIRSAVTTVGELVRAFVAGDNK